MWFFCSWWAWGAGEEYYIYKVWKRRPLLLLAEDQSERRSLNPLPQTPAFVSLGQEDLVRGMWSVRFGMLTEGCLVSLFLTLWYACIQSHLVRKSTSNYISWRHVFIWDRRLTGQVGRCTLEAVPLLNILATLNCTPRLGQLHCHRNSVSWSVCWFFWNINCDIQW